MSEHDEQTALIEWAQWTKKQVPELDYLYAYPSGQLRPQQVTRSGKRFSVIGKRLKAEGVRAGIPDLFLPVALGEHHGLYLEMKFDKNKPTSEQRWWLEQLSKQGYFCVVPYSMEEAAWWILNYLLIPTGEILSLLPTGWQDKVDVEKLLKNTLPHFARE